MCRFSAEVGGVSSGSGGLGVEGEHRQTAREQQQDHRLRH